MKPMRVPDLRAMKDRGEKIACMDGSTTSRWPVSWIGPVSM
jgi:hypothetical protein